MDDRCPRGHDVGFLKHIERVGYTLTIAQDNVEGDMRPWCIPERFPVERRTVWARVYAVK